MSGAEAATFQRRGSPSICGAGHRNCFLAFPPQPALGKYPRTFQWVPQSSELTHCSRKNAESDTSSYAVSGPFFRVINWPKKSYWDTLSSSAMGRYKANVDVVASWAISKSTKILASPLFSVMSQQHTTAGLEGQVWQAAYDLLRIPPWPCDFLVTLCFNCRYMGCTALDPELLHNTGLSQSPLPMKRGGMAPNPSLDSHGSEHYPGSALRLERAGSKASATTRAEEAQWGGVGTGWLFCQVSHLLLEADGAKEKAP